ncbi:MAG: HD-GYP domain-containing protein [Tissierellales bacterium]
MILLPLKMVREGMINAKPIYTSKEQLLLDEGIVVKERYLERLGELGIRSLYIIDDLADKVIIHDIVKEEFKMNSISKVEEIMRNICCFDEKEVEGIKKDINNIIEELLTQEDVLLNLCEIRSIDDYTYGHSVNVSILSLITAINLGYSKDQLLELGIGALLHDIGKTKISLKIVNKPSSLTTKEFNEIKNHTTLGYEILSDIENLSSNSKDIVLMHHERFDGNGYPNNLKGKEIPEFARIVAIADVYDAMINDRVYRLRVSTDNALDYVVSVSGTQFDDSLVQEFIKNIARYPVGQGIVLNTGFKGYVISNKKNHRCRPTVRILYNYLGERLEVPYITDLSIEDDSIKIIGVTNDIELF